MLPSTTDRVSDQTADAVNQRIEAETEARIAHCADHPDDIPARLQQLDR